tara:strand:+ start:93 stop:425 length:333 start_codon:yes stop_codon:yes gene_type:complete
MSKNKTHTQGYFIKRLRDNGYYVIRLFESYSIPDPRSWTIVVNPEVESVFITCYRDNFGSTFFEFNDGGKKFAKNFQLITDSLEVIMVHLHEKGITGKNRLNKLDHASQE